jgi:hypothetical protein
MKFRDKFAKSPIFLLSAVFLAPDILFDWNFSTFWKVRLAAIILLSIVISFLNTIFSYYELNSDCLRLRKLWKKKEIPWSEVTRVGRLGFSNHDLKIYYGRRIENYDLLVISPWHQTRFIEQMKTLAPNVQFDL